MESLNKLSKYDVTSPDYDPVKTKQQTDKLAKLKADKKTEADALGITAAEDKRLAEAEMRQTIADAEAAIPPAATTIIDDPIEIEELGRTVIDSRGIPVFIRKEEEDALRKQLLEEEMERFIDQGAVELGEMDATPSIAIDPPAMSLAEARAALTQPVDIQLPGVRTPIKLGDIDISFTNASLFMVISSIAILIIFNLGSKKNSLVPSKIQLLAELSYSFVSKMISDTAGSKAKPYFAFIFSLFMFVLFCNMFGMIPYSFTVTSHIIVTFVLAAFIFIGVTIIGFIKHGLGYLKLFVPSGVPMILLPLIVVIEIISYLSRPISLSVRLFANMMAGHTMMKVFGGFVVSLGIIGGWLPLSFSVALTGLEILVAFLQAYVFAILTCIYLNDALNLHH